MEDLFGNFSLKLFSLEGKVAMVTGGNTGIGQSLVIALAKAGANVFVPAYSETSWKETQEMVEEVGRNVGFYRADLTSREDIKASIQTCLDMFGRIDILINNAGTIRRAPILEYSDEDWQAVMEINLSTVFYMSKDVAKIMAENGGGKIINIASMLSFQGGKFVPAYTASKHGVAGLTKAFANELAHLNIQVNAIAPGYIKTANTAPLRADEKRNQEILERIPAGRWGEVSDLMGTAVFLASDAASYINGHTLAVDGGWLVR